MELNIDLSIWEAMRKSHLSRHQLRRIRAEICAAFSKAGLADYLPKKNR